MVNVNFHEVVWIGFQMQRFELLQLWLSQVLQLSTRIVTSICPSVSTILKRRHFCCDQVDIYSLVDNAAT